MHEVSVSDAKKGFTSLLKRVQQGEITIITRRGKPVGAMMDFQEYQKLRRLRAYSSIRQLSQDLSDCGITATELHRISRRELEEEGR